jgi:PAS domain S-box-containing protein
MTALAASPSIANFGAYLFSRSLQVERYRTVVDTCPIPAFICEPTGECAYVNSAYTDMLGILPEATLGNAWERFVHPEDLKWMKAHWRHALDTQRVFEQRVRYIHQVSHEIVDTFVRSALLPCLGQVGFCLPADVGQYPHFVPLTGAPKAG